MTHTQEGMSPRSGAEFEAVRSPRGPWPSHLALPVCPWVPLPDFAPPASLSLSLPKGRMAARKGQSPHGLGKSPLGLQGSFLLDCRTAPLPLYTHINPKCGASTKPLIKKLVNFLLIKINTPPH